jgi:hypothetical protein
MFQKSRCQRKENRHGNPVPSPIRLLYRVRDKFAETDDFSNFLRRNWLRPSCFYIIKKEQKNNYMKKVICLIACSLVLGLSPVFGQQQPSSASGAAALVTFNLNFPGGGPMELVKAIEDASGKPLNVIISKQDEDVELPPLKMTGVNVARLFQALGPMSVKNVTVATGLYGYYGGSGGLTPQYSIAATSYGFKTTGEPTENSIWYFHVQRPSDASLVSPGKVCYFFSLAPYLERGFTVDDITTAIQTGWKMAGDTSLPELNYHKETKLLLAFGDPAQLRTIDAVLRTLPSSNATRSELDSMRQAIKHLQAEVDAFPPPPSKMQGVPQEEKSGK